MTAPRWPDVYAALLTLLSSLPGDFTVYDAQPLAGDNPLNYVTVGYVSDDSAGSFLQDRAASGFATSEQGEIKCHVVSNSGDTTPDSTRATAFGFVGDWQSALEADRTLGGVLPVDTVLNLSAEVMAVQNSQGSATSLLVALSYLTTTYF